MGKVRELVKKAADRNKDGEVNLKDASFLAGLLTAKFPLGALVGAFGAGAVVGAFLHSVLR
jgi:hypothetical protein